MLAKEAPFFLENVFRIRCYLHSNNYFSKKKSKLKIRSYCHFNQKNKNIKGYVKETYF